VALHIVGNRLRPLATDTCAICVAQCAVRNPFEMYRLTKTGSEIWDALILNLST